MDYELKELNIDMNQDVYEMYQAIPDGENGQENKCYGMSFNEYKEYLKKEIQRKNNKVTYDDTPCITYIMYVNNYPVGFICLRTKIDENWKKWSGKCYYSIRSSERKKGYATKMLSLALEKFKELNFESIYIQSSDGNRGSAKVIENNYGMFLREVEGTRYYKILIK